jgi:hypothetical protein
MTKEDKIIALLEELVKWTKVTSFPHVKNLLLEILGSPEEKIAYQSSDGERSSRDVAEIANVSQFTIAKWWKIWIKAGIADPVQVQRGERAKCIFSLDEFGIQVPEIQVTIKGNKGGEQRN